MRRDSRQPTRSARASSRREAAPSFAELQTVYILAARPDLGLDRGESGTIVHAVHDADAPAYLVEFVGDDGHTRAEAFFTPDQLSTTPPG